MRSKRTHHGLRVSSHDECKDYAVLNLAASSEPLVALPAL
jgi:hypothetical protein